MRTIQEQGTTVVVMIHPLHSGLPGRVDHHVQGGLHQSPTVPPICTGVMGSQFRYARAILPLFGSEFVYCHTGIPTAEGQYSVGEFVQLRKLLGI